MELFPFVKFPDSYVDEKMSPEPPLTQGWAVNEWNVNFGEKQPFNELNLWNVSVFVRWQTINPSRRRSYSNKSRGRLTVKACCCGNYEWAHVMWSAHLRAQACKWMAFRTEPWLRRHLAICGAANCCRAGKSAVGSREPELQLRHLVQTRCDKETCWSFPER